MKFATAKEHKDFFRKHEMIEFADFLTSNQLLQFNQAIHQALSIRLPIPFDRMESLSAEQLFIQGRDLWRAHKELHKWVVQTRWAEIAAELTEMRPLRLGYDQLLPSSSVAIVKKEQIYANFIQQTPSLAEISCIEGLACGLVIALSSSSSTASPPISSNLNIFPSQAGNAIFFQPHALIDLNPLREYLGQHFYLITYAHASARYQFEPRDPHTHLLKHLGYVVHHPLSDRLNPILVR
jgi:hypothetical protein